MVSVGPVLRGRRRASRSSRTLGDEERDDLGQKKLSQSVRKRGSRSRAHHLRVWQIRNYPYSESPPSDYVNGGCCIISLAAHTILVQIRAPYLLNLRNMWPQRAQPIPKLPRSSITLSPPMWKVKFLCMLRAVYFYCNFWLTICKWNVPILEEPPRFYMCIFFISLPHQL